MKKTRITWIAGTLLIISIACMALDRKPVAIGQCLVSARPDTTTNGPDTGYTAIDTRFLFFKKSLQ